MQLIENISDLRAHRAKTKASIAFVPTMGNLHQGHLALVAAAKQQADQVWVSIFVNPLQFGVGEDFEHYPRTQATDCAALKAAGVDLVFLPQVSDIYPRPLAEITQIHVPILSEQLCGAYRAGHFDGVSTVVARLFNLVQPQLALFGEKDLQQLRIIQRMVADLGINVQIESVATVREQDGLAKSSRNQYLSSSERVKAMQLYQSLQTIQTALLQGQRDYATLEQTALDTLTQAGFKPDYVQIREADFLQAPTKNSQQFAILAAAYLGKARLIDNIRLDLSQNTGREDKQ